MAEVLQAAAPAAPIPPTLPTPAAAPPTARTQATGQGGERPLYTPRINEFGHAEGDTYTYRVLDTWKDTVLGSYTTAIEEVLDDGQLLANGQQTAMDAQGRLKRQRQADGSASQFEPAQELWWSQPQPGERRSVRFVEKYERPGLGRGEIEFKGSSKVGRLRKIETPAGEFEALPIETSGWTYETARAGGLVSNQFSRTVWYAPKLGQPVAIDIEDADRLGKLLRRERVELMHAQQAPRATP
ncbi:hypothetical protein RA210_U30404 [Rubrivivax sp. A210]|nr:hypothetical protein RA210_U30404 [Rubrivivax sp. A210]